MAPEGPPAHDTGAATRLHTAGAICVHLYNQDPQAAWQTFQDVMDVEVFANSDEAFTADALFQAYK